MNADQWADAHKRDLIDRQGMGPTSVGRHTITTLRRAP